MNAILICFYRSQYVKTVMIPNETLFWDPHKHINTLCEQNVEFVNVKRSGTYSYYWALKVEPEL
jgi:hypothetical protein